MRTSTERKVKESMPKIENFSWPPIKKSSRGGKMQSWGWEASHCLTCVGISYIETKRLIIQTKDQKNTDKMISICRRWIKEEICWNALSGGWRLKTTRCADCWNAPARGDLPASDPNNLGYGWSSPDPLINNNSSPDHPIGWLIMEEKFNLPPTIFWIFEMLQNFYTIIFTLLILIIIIIIILPINFNLYIIYRVQVDA